MSKYLEHCVYLPFLPLIKSRIKTLRNNLEKKADLPSERLKSLKSINLPGVISILVLLPGLPQDN